MARVIRLPSGRVFRAEPLVKDPKKLSMGNKGAFDFSETVKLLDQVAESKGIGALANVAEKGYDAIRGDVKRPTEDKPADALTQAAKARVGTKGTVPAQAQKPSTEIRTETSDKERGPLLRQPGRPEQTQRFTPEQLKAIRELDEAGAEMGRETEREERERRIRKNMQRISGRSFQPDDSEIRTRLQGQAPTIEEAARLRLGMQPLPPTPGGAPLAPVMDVPVQPAPIPAADPRLQRIMDQSRPAPVQPINVAPTLIRAGGPQQASPGQIAAPPMARAVPVPVSGMTPPSYGGADVPRGQTMQQAGQAAATQVAANVRQEARRETPAPAAEIDITRFESPTGQARGSIDFFRELAGELGARGIGMPNISQEPIDIPYTVSIDQLYGYAKNAQTPQNQKLVLDALANNRVTGMGFSTIADRLSGAYRQRYLKNVVALFPKQQKAPNLIDAIGTVGKAYASEQLGRRRARDISAGAAEEGVAKTRAGTAKLAAGAQRSAEQAVTDRETRAGRVNLLAAQASSKIFESAIKAIKAKKRRGTGRRRAKPLVKDFVKLYEGTFSKEQGAGQKRLDDLLDIQRKLKLKAGQAKAGAKVTTSERVLNKTAAAAKSKAIREANAARGQLNDIAVQIRNQRGLLNDLARKRGAFSAFAGRTLLQNRQPTDAELQAFGLTQQQVLDAREAIAGPDGRYQRSQRRKPSGKRPTNRPTNRPKKKTAEDFLD